MYVKPTPIHVAAALFPVTRMHEPGNEKVELGIPLLFIISIDPRGEFEVFTCTVFVCAIREPDSQRQNTLTREHSKDCSTPNTVPPASSPWAPHANGSEPKDRFPIREELIGHCLFDMLRLLLHNHGSENVV